MKPVILRMWLLQLYTCVCCLPTDFLYSLISCYLREYDQPSYHVTVLDMLKSTKHSACYPISTWMCSPGKFSLYKFISLYTRIVVQSIVRQYIIRILPLYLFLLPFWTTVQDFFRHDHWSVIFQINHEKTMSPVISLWLNFNSRVTCC